MVKFFMILSSFSLFLLISYFSVFDLKILGKNIFSFHKEILPPFDSSIVVDSQSMLFFLMVALVTCVVALYSELYMDHYNFKKYSFLTFSFFLSMLILSSSHSYVNILLGWDGLGVSSLCLIMFYPNKTSSYNSFLTFFFNRLGDLFLLVIFSSFLLDNLFFCFLYDNFSSFFLFLLLLCTFTKGAQFPLSAWLPAAMSAPTPISAMVHSSTLVTAGIYILWKFFFFFEFFSLSLMFTVVALLTFFAGGAMANGDTDLKKVVAFSTMSQISMIVFFLGLGFLSISMFHMFNHALFKTLIFCSCGLLFVFNCGDQSSLSPGQSSLHTNVLAPLMFSIFLMTGFQFSSSFFTKDLILECLNDTHTQLMFFLLILGGMFTIFYSGFILSCSLNSSLFLKKNYFSIKFFSPKFNFFICLASALFSFSLSKTLFLVEFPTVSFFMIFLIVLLMIFPLFKSSILGFNFMFFNFELSYSKMFIFSNIGNLLLKDSYSFFSSDQIFFKPFPSSFPEKLKNFTPNNVSILFSMFLFLSLFFFF